jgi:hypothetical protein
MHLTGSLMATFEATKRFDLPRMVERMVGGFLNILQYLERKPGLRWQPAARAVRHHSADITPESNGALIPGSPRLNLLISYIHTFVYLYVAQSIVDAPLSTDPSHARVAHAGAAASNML